MRGRDMQRPKKIPHENEDYMQTEIIKVAGIKNQADAEIIQQSLSGLPGVAEVRVTSGSGRATVRYEEELASSVQLRATLIQLGFEVDAAAGKSHSGCCGACGG
jgi:cation transport ATPase